jgi:tetratricopeptide (TPR) repeat protein
VWVSLIAFLLVLGASLAMLPTTLKNKREPTPVAVIFFAFIGITVALRLIPGLGSSLGLSDSYVALFPEQFPETLRGSPGTLHLAPGAGFWALLHLVTIGLALGTTHQLCRRYPRLRERILRRVVYGGAIVTGIGMIGLLSGTDLITWIYTPQEVSRQEIFSSTFLNPNHLAGYLTFIMGMAIALSLRDQNPFRRFCIQITAFLAGGGAFLTLSRAGMSGLVATLALVGLVLWFRKRKVETYGMRHFIIILTAAIGAGFITLLIASNFITALDMSGATAHGGVDGKLRVLDTAWATLKSAPFWGIGPGAFADVSATHQSIDANLVYTHVENLPLQLLVDHGILLGTLFMGTAIVFLARLGRDLSGDPSALLMFSAIALLLWHNFFDFNLSLSGVAIPAAITLGVLSSTQRTLEINFLRRGVGTIVLILLGLWSLKPSMHNARSEVQHRTASYVRTAHGLTDEINEDLRAFPRSPELITAAGLAVERKQGVKMALPFYDYASTLGPTRFFPSLMRARAYQQAGELQLGTDAYIRVCHLDRGLMKNRRQWMSALLGLPGGKALIPGLTESDPECTRSLIKYSISQKQIGPVVELSRLALEGRPGDPRFLYWHGRSLLELGRREEASQVAGILLGLHSDSAEGFLLTGIMSRNKSNFEAMHLFSEALNRAPNWAEPALLLAQTSILEKDEKHFFRAMHGLSQSRGNRGKGPQTHALEGQFAYANGDFESATRSFRRAGPWLQKRAPLMLQFLDSLARIGKKNSALALCERAHWPESLAARAVKLCDSIRSDQSIPSR